MKRVLVLHFPHPEGYPPALNAINAMSEKVDSLKIITTDTLPTKWTYHENVNFELVEGEHDRFSFVKKSPKIRLIRYLTFIRLIRKSIHYDKPDLVVIYDNVPFLFYLIAVLGIRKHHKLWYHNHDIYPLSQYPKYSILWLSFLAVQKYFNKINFFSIPSMERKSFFPLKRFDGKFFFIPNYPSRRIINNIEGKQDSLHESRYLKLIYPGSPSVKNGFEELIDIMSTNVRGKTITLTIVGETNQDYRYSLNKYARKKGVEKQLFFENRVPYTEMPNFLRNYHVGWAMYKPQDTRTATVATASNKIYEFLANAMPIMVFDNEHHREHLSETAATFFTDLTKDSILETLKKILQNYKALSQVALKEFEEKYQFEKSFDNALKVILN